MVSHTDLNRARLPIPPYLHTRFGLENHTLYNLYLQVNYAILIVFFEKKG